MVNRLVDTAILIDLLKLYPPAVEWHDSTTNVILMITPLVWMEVIEGEGNKFRQQQAIKFLKQFEMVYLTAEDQMWAVEQHVKVYLRYGTGLDDCLIAASAHRLQIPLYTRNLKHFEPLLGPLAQQPY